MMAPVNSCMATQFRQLIYYHLDNHLLHNAQFFAERLLAYDPRSAESSYLLALCHLRASDFKSAFEFTKSPAARATHLGCAYVFAQAALELERFKDGINALDKTRGLWGGRNGFGKHTQYSRNPHPDAAAIYCLLGKLHLGYDDKKKAISSFEEALKLNPFMWDAFTTLCDMGVNVRVPNIFKMGPEMKAIMRTTARDTDQISVAQVKDPALVTMFNDYAQNRPGPRPTPFASEVLDPFNNVPSRSLAGGLFGTLGLSQKLSESNPSVSNISATNGPVPEPDGMETPNGPSTAVDVSINSSRKDPGVVSAYTLEPPQAPVRKNRAVQEHTVDALPKIARSTTMKRLPRSQHETSESAESVNSTRMSSLLANGGDRKRTVSGQVIQSRHATGDNLEAPQRRSARILNSIRPSGSKSTAFTGNLGPTQSRELKKARPPISSRIRPGSSTSTVGRIVSGNRKPSDDNMDVDAKDHSSRLQHAPNGSTLPNKSTDADSGKQEEAMRLMLDLFKTLGAGYFALSQFRCQDALQIYTSIPRAQQETPWVLAQIGRAYYEQAAYGEAETYYRRIRAIAPTRYEDMEIYSTILWYLKRETDLSFLAHELIDAEWSSEYAWVAMGNAWSLARDHEAALKCFKRATQINPKFAYAFTLQGHEYVQNEEYDKAMQAYRRSISADKRHYNAYYGIARVYDRLGEYEKAIQHFIAASKINPTNAILTTWVGSILEKQKQPRKALAHYTKGIELAPGHRSALTRFKKARVLMTIGELQSALAELMVLKDMAPDEPQVHFLLGKLYKALREKGLAVRHFTISLNLDPKASQQIKDAIESLDDDEDYEYDDNSMMS